MASAATSARLRYLHNAASHLFIAAPTSAAAFEAEIGSIAEKAGLTLPDYRRQDICTACGNILAPGLSCTVAIESAPSFPSKRARGQRNRKSIAVQLEYRHKLVEKIMVYTCKRCSKSTRVSAGVPPRARKVRARNKPEADKTFVAGSMLNTPTKTALAQAEVAESDIAPPAPSAKGLTNAGSKQRAKARKQSSLQALLAKNKASANTLSGSGLDLMDFMEMG